MERRSFLKNAAAAAPFIGQAFGASDEIRIAQVGLGTRGAYELEVCQRTKGCKVLAVADVYQPLVDKAVAGSNGTLTGYQDFRGILDRQDIDAVFVSTPDHWHAPIAHHGLPGGQRRLLLEAAQPHPARGPADGGRRAQTQPRFPDRQPAALRHPLSKSRGADSQRPHRQGRLPPE